MSTIAPLLLCLLSAVVEVHSQTAPYLTFMDNNIPNHSYVDLNTVGTGNTNEVQCHTDLQSRRAVVVLRVLTVETGTSPMETDYHF